MKRILFTLLLCSLTLSSFSQTRNAHEPQLQLIRNATLVIDYNGKRILVDPMLGAKASLPSFSDKNTPNPSVDLTMPISEIIDNIDLVLVSHTHADHFDETASKSLNKSIKLIHQPSDKNYFTKERFINAMPITDSLTWEGITLIRTNAQHGTGRILEEMGNVAGYILKSEGQPTVYIVGDAIWTEELYQNMRNYNPDYIVINSGGALIPGYENTPIIMDENQAMSVIQESGNAKVIAVHMDAINHCYTTRNILKKKAKENNISKEKLIVPEDGEIINL